MKIVYHNADLDGLCCAAIAQNKFDLCRDGSENVLIGMDYGDTFPWEDISEDEKLIFMDFCLEPFSEMEKLSGICETLTVIDHHPTTEKGMQQYDGVDIDCIYSSSMAGCELAWNEFYPSAYLPEAIVLLGAYDRWDRSDEDLWNERILPFQYGLRTKVDRGRDFTPNDMWGDLLFATAGWREESVDYIVGIGEGVISYRRRTNEEVATQYHMTELDGHQAVAINGTCADNSMLFDSAPDADVMVNYYWVGSHNRWTVEMYSDGDVDVSEIAKHHGGGGHEGAAGFQCGELPFPLITCQPTTAEEDI